MEVKRGMGVPAASPVVVEVKGQQPDQVKPKKKAYESIKSLGSTASQGSTGSSKVSSSSGSDTSGSMSNKLEFIKKTEMLAADEDDKIVVNPHIMDPNVPDTENPELLNHLQFVSPKAGVFRPVNQGSPQKSNKGGGKGGKHSCSLM